MVESYTNMYEPVTHLLFADRDTIIGGDAVVNIFCSRDNANIGIRGFTT